MQITSKKQRFNYISVTIGTFETHLHAIRIHQFSFRISELYDINFKRCKKVHPKFDCIGCAGATFSGKKMQICRPKVIILGQKCTQEGREPEDAKVDKIKNWPPLKTIRDVRAFLGLWYNAHLD